MKVSRNVFLVQVREGQRSALRFNQLISELILLLRVSRGGTGSTVSGISTLEPRVFMRLSRNGATSEGTSDVLGL